MLMKNTARKPPCTNEIYCVTFFLNDVVVLCVGEEDGVDESARGVAMMTVDTDDTGPSTKTTASDEGNKRIVVDRGDQFVLHFYDLAAKKPHTQYKFARRGIAKSNI